MRQIVVLFLVATLFGCSSKDEPRAELRIPVLTECVDTINRAKSHYLNTSSSQPYELDIDIVKFDETGSLYDGPVGMATLVSIGEWKTLDGGSPLAYLRLTANGIFADCAPSSTLTILFENNPSVTAKEVASIAKSKGAKEVEISSQGVTIKFNDGSYEYPF